jgi:hypothetical protein
MSEKSYITREELDVFLRGYEKIGSLDSIASQIDGALRKYILESFETNVGAIKRELSASMNNLSQKFESMIKQSADSSKTANLREVIELSKVQIEAQSRNIMTETLKTIDKKSSEIRNNIEQSISQKLLINEKEIDSKVTTLKSLIWQEIMNYQSMIENLCVSSIQKAIESQRTTIEGLIEDTLHNHYSKIKEDMTQLRLVIMSELENKIVDKKLIDERLADMEKQLVSKTQNVINFQLEQSRAMMEQSARAEITDSLKHASKDILNSLL